MIRQKLPEPQYFSSQLGNSDTCQSVMEELEEQHKQVLEAAKHAQRMQQVEQKLLQLQRDKLKLAEAFKKQHES